MYLELHYASGRVNGLQTWGRGGGGGGGYIYVNKRALRLSMRWNVRQWLCTGGSVRASWSYPVDII